MKPPPPLGARIEPGPGPNSDSNRPPLRCGGADATAARYCAPQLFCASATRIARRWPSRSGAALSPRSRSRSALMRSRLPRICEIFEFSGPHCGFWPPLNSTKKLLLSQFSRRACACWRSSSLCWPAAASSYLRICSARACRLRRGRRPRAGLPAGCRPGFLAAPDPPAALAGGLLGLRRRELLRMRADRRREHHGGRCDGPAQH